MRYHAAVHYALTYVQHLQRKQLSLIKIKKKVSFVKTRLESLLELEIIYQVQARIKPLLCE